VASDFDAGIHIGELIQRDMIAVRVSADLRLAVVGSPDYFQRRPIPQTPEDLKVHSCIGFRFGGKVYRWEFEKGRKMLTVYPQGPITFDDPDLVIRAALRGLGSERHWNSKSSGSLRSADSPRCCRIGVRRFLASSSTIRVVGTVQQHWTRSLTHSGSE
jgi:LysR substrate binding domain-containing protein